MILDGVVSNFKEVALQNLAIGGVGATVGTGLAVAGAPVAIPIVAGAAGALAIVTTAKHFKDFIQNKIFISRVEKIEKWAEKNNVDPADIQMKFTELNAYGSFENTKSFKRLMDDKDLAQYGNKFGDPSNHVKITNEQFHQAMEQVRSKALENDGFTVKKPDVGGLRSKFFGSSNKNEYKPT